MNARRAGFDGVEVHAQRGYLIAQFLNPALNLRTDSYGGNPENSARFLLEVLDAVTGAWGPHQVGVKFAPYQVMNPALGFSLEILANHEYAATSFNDYQLAYLHLMMVRQPNVPVSAEQQRETLLRFRPA